MKALFDGRIVLTHHARHRLKERGVNFIYIERQLRFKPYAEGTHKWYLDNNDGYFVVYADKHKLRTVITTGKDAKEAVHERVKG